jgi:AcrR family transcriptional regulator
MAVAEATKKRLLEAAGQVFAEKGFRAATIRDIRDRAGCNLAAINYHFGDKKGLYIAVVRHIAEENFREVPLPTWPPGTPPVEKLRGFIRYFANRLIQDQEPAWAMQIMMRELFQPTEACIEFVRQFVRPNFEVLLGILAEILPPDFPPLQRYQVAFSIVGQCLHYRLTRPVLRLLLGEGDFERLDAERIADHVSRFSLAALGLTPSLTMGKEAS